jgi:hypothetical protein
MLVTEEVDGELNKLPGFHFYCGLPYSNGMNFKGMWSGAGKGSLFYVMCHLGVCFWKHFQNVSPPPKKKKNPFSIYQFFSNYKKKLCEAKENY